jgi:hypothetical protein
MADNELIVTGLTQLELRELEKALGKSSITSKTDKTSKFREPITLIIATVAISSAAITALTIILTRTQDQFKRINYYKKRRLYLYLQ